jgi:hypothetical protein
MKTTSLRWTSGLLLGACLLMAVAARTRGSHETPVRSRPVEVRPAPPPEDPAEIAPAPPPPPKESPAPGPVPAAAWANGYREAGETGGEGTLTGHVLTPEGPMAGGLVNVEWVMAFRPTSEEARRLRLGGARRDRDGVWWGKMRAVTDEAGFFSVDGLPTVQLKVSAGGRAQSARVGQNVLLRTGNP